MGEWRSCEEWLAQVPETIRSEEMWRFFGYRKALFFHDLYRISLVSEVIALLVTEIQRGRRTGK